MFALAQLRRALPPLRALVPLTSAPWSVPVRHASKASGGTGGVCRTSRPKYLGLRIWGDSFAKAGSTIAVQRGLKWRPGENVGVGRNDTLYAIVDGFVEFKRQKKVNHTNKKVSKHYVHVRAESKEEFEKRVAERVAKRNKTGCWTRLQAGDFVSRRAPIEAGS